MKKLVDKGVKKKKSAGDAIADFLIYLVCLLFMYLSVLLHHDLFHQRSESGSYRDGASAKRLQPGNLPRYLQAQ